MGLGGGGGGGTTTQVVNNTPFNAQELKTVQDNAIGLLGSNPFQYYPGQTYAGPSDLQTFGYPRVGNLGINSGDYIGGSIPGVQAQALNTNNSFAEGDNFHGAYPYFDQLGSLGAVGSSIGQGQAGVSNDVLNNISTGGYFGLPTQWASQLTTPQASTGGNFLTGIAGSGYFPGIQPEINGLNQAAWNNQASLVANGAYLNSVSNNYGNPLGMSGLTGPGAAPLANLYNGAAYTNIQPYTNALYGTTNGPDYANLSAFGGGNALGSVSPYASGAAGVANGSAVGSLNQTAAGSYLNGNPYLDATFKSASDPLINAFQTAIAPTVDSRMAAAGRFNSGATANSQSVAQQNLGKSLADLSAGIYEPAYENERNRMVQAGTNAANAQTAAYGTAGNLINQGVQNAITGATSAGSLRNSALSNAGNIVNNASGILQNAATSANSLYQSGLLGAGNLYNQGVGTLASSGLGLGNLNLQGLLGAGGLYNNAANTATSAAEALQNASTTGLSNAITGYNSGVNTMNAAGLGLGNLGVQNTNARTNVINSALSHLYDLGQQQENAALATPQLTQMPFADYQAAISAGSAQQQLQQQALQDAQNRFYGIQQAPYNNLASVAGIIGGAIPGSAATTTPFFTNPLGQITGGIGAANSLFGNNGLFGGGGSGAFDSSLPSFAQFGTPSAAELASATGSSLFGAAAPFTDFAGSGAFTSGLTSAIAAGAPVADAGAGIGSFLPALALGK